MALLFYTFPMKDTPTLHSLRLTLRPFVLEDAADVYKWCSSFKCAEYLFWHPHRDLGVTTRLLTNWTRKKRNYSWALVKDGHAIGEVQVIKDIPEAGAEIGYILAEEAWGQGYMSEALGVIIPFLQEKGYRYLYAETDERNERSRHLLERQGFLLTETEVGRYIAKKDETINVAKYRKSL